tara:strand:+ start:5989 stop:6639 length:651 start_codon:yes stop_codon:yes gene_type:complete
MPYIPPKYFAGATTIVANDIQENLDGLRDYVSGNVRSTDLKTTNWAGPRHIMRGRLDPIANQYKLVSGVLAGRTSETNETSWISKSTTGSAGGSNPSFSYYPNSAITFELEQDAHVIMTFYASPVHPVGSSENTYLYIYVDGTDQITMTRNTSRSEEPPLGGATGYSGEHQARNNFAGYHMLTLSKGTHALTLKGYSDSIYTFLCNWGVSLEAYYK